MTPSSSDSEQKDEEAWPDKDKDKDRGGRNMCFTTVNTDKIQFLQLDTTANCLHMKQKMQLTWKSAFFAECTK